MNLTTPESVRKLQRALYAKAKANPAYRFYTRTIRSTERTCYKRPGAAVEQMMGALESMGKSFEGIERKGVERWLEQLAQELRSKTYRPQAVQRVCILKADWKKRPLGFNCKGSPQAGRCWS